MSTYGGAYVSMCWDDSSYNATTKAHYYAGTAGTNHGVVVVGQIKKLAKVVKTISVGRRATNAALSYRYAAKLARGRYTWRVLATDAAGNVATRMAAAKLVIR